MAIALEGWAPRARIEFGRLVGTDDYTPDFAGKVDIHVRD